MARCMFLVFCCVVLFLGGCSDTYICTSDLQELEDISSIIKKQFNKSIRQLNHSDCGYIYNVLEVPSTLHTRVLCEKAQEDLKSTNDQYLKFAAKARKLKLRTNPLFCSTKENAAGEPANVRFAEFQLGIANTAADMSSTYVTHLNKILDQLRPSGR